MRPILIFLVLSVLTITVSAQERRPEIALLLAECETVKGACEFQHLVRYGFRNGEQVSREVIFSGRTTHVRYDLGQNHIYQNRYVITNWGDVVDVVNRKLVHEGDGEYVAAENDRVIERVHTNATRGFFFFELKSGRYSRLIHPGKWGLPGLLSPDQTKSVSADRQGSGSIWLYTLNGRKKLLASGFTANPYGCDRPKPPLLWVDNDRVLTQRSDGNLVILGMRGEVAPLVTIALANSASVAELYRNDDSKIVYQYGDETYYIDVANKRYSGFDYDWINLGSEFQVETKNDDPSGRVIRFRGQEIGRWQTSYARTTTDYIALKYGSVAMREREGVRVWSTSNKSWSNIDPGWVTQIIGWIK